MFQSSSRRHADFLHCIVGVPGNYALEVYRDSELLSVEDIVLYSHHLGNFSLLLCSEIKVSLNGAGGEQEN